MKKTMLFVGGSHCSGTSAFAGSAMLLGGGTAHDMIAASPGNPKGHFESVAVVEANDKLLSSLGRVWFDFRPMPATDATRTETAANTFAKILENDFVSTGLYIVKDPRICLLTREWIAAAHKMQARPLFVTLLRHPAECASSLVRRDGFSFPDAVTIWLRHMLDYEFGTRSEARILVKAEDFVDSPVDVLNAVSAELDFEWPRSPDSERAGIASFVEHKLMSNRIEESCPELSFAEEVYDLWLQPESTQRAEAFDRMRQKLDQITPDLYASLVQRQLESVLPLRWERDRLEKQKAELSAILLQKKPGSSQFSGLDETVEYASPNEVCERAASYLRKPFKSLIKSKSAQLLAKNPLLSDQRRAKLLQSAAKRDHKALSGQLRELAAADMSEISGTTGFDQASYANSLVPGRRNLLLSPTHVGIHTTVARADTNSLPSITLSFVTYNSARWLKGLFVSLLAQDYPLDRLNLIFVDNGSSDDTIALADEFIRQNGSLFLSATVKQQPNLGFGAGHDLAIRTSNDQFVLVSNVDIEFHRQTMVRLVATALVDDADVASWEARQCPYEHPKYYDPVSLETAWSSHACILLRKEAYLAVGGYDKRIFMYGEDVELSYRFRGAGYRLRYLPQAPITHYVDFIDTSLRPHQLSGSVASNVLLRHRYGNTNISRAGDILLSKKIASATNAAHRDALIKAQHIVTENLNHFQNELLPKQQVAFPFHGFGYEIARIGHDVKLSAPAWGADAPLVSIVTRTYGSQTEFLREAIVSVLNQSYPNIEHIVVEDRTDAARDLVEATRTAYGSNIRYVKSDGAGRSAAGNAGLAAAQGDLLMFLDADDLLLGDHVELLVSRLMAQTEPVAAYTLAWEIPTYFNPSGIYREGAPVIPKEHLEPFSNKRLSRGNFIPIQAIMFRRALFDKAGGFDQEIDHLEDWHLWSRYAALGAFICVPKVTSLYRTPGDSYFRQQRKTVMLAAERRVREQVKTILQGSLART